jgi:putative ABC transport system ATP-binding protein
MIRVKKYRKSYTARITVETLALNNISLDIHKGEFLSIMGPSGCWHKAPLLNIMGLLDAPTKGDIAIDEQLNGKLSDKQLAHFRTKK